MCSAIHYTPFVPSSVADSSKVGSFIRQQVIPVGMTVTEAARKLGVGRPALSNLLNGRAALSPDMALRLEGTFGADRTKLLELQAESDQERRRVVERAVPVGTYAPGFLTIKARQIADWAAENIQARERLPVLLRRLVHATGRELHRVDFPGYDNAQRHGWDGRVEADAATPWVPEGKSFWEFGVDQRPAAKAERDYQARLNALAPAERAECTFVFVTPRNWKGKAEWVRNKEAAGDWKAVRAFDASDMEQWLETTIAPRIWLARELGIPTEGFKTLDHFWSSWAAASDPPMTSAIFTPSVTVHGENFKKWLEEAPPDRPYTVAADSREEAVAFIACLLRHRDLPADVYDRAVVFESAATLRILAPSSSPFIPITYVDETEREIAAQYRQRHCIVVRPRNAVDREPDVAVELLSHAAFEQALADMGVEQERVDRLASESGRSPTVLRRRLSHIPAIKTPAWAGDEAVARRIIPIALVGAWHAASNADRRILAKLAGRDYDEVEKHVADLLQRDDGPVWCVDQYRGVVSKIDALFAIAPRMTEKDVVDFVGFAKYVLSESDPALELPEDQQWAAGLYGKVRDHSNALRTGVCETLVMLSVHGNALFRNRLGIDVASRVADLIKGLLKPFTSETLRSNDRDLPAYAEAAPDEFLKLLEEDLRQPKPVLLALLKPVGAGVFEHPWRTGLLWALERLAWNPRNLMRVVNILARLSQTKIDDNWVNKPIGSLSAIFLRWLPQTAASLDDRIKALETLCRRFPDIGWQICIQQFEGGQQFGHFSDRPRWRNDAAGAGRGVRGRERCEFARKALDLAMSWPAYDVTALGDLVERIGNMGGEDQSRVWDTIDVWSRQESDEKAKTALRTRLRRTVLGRRGRLSGLNEEQRQRARLACDALAPRDPVKRRAWLFVPGALWEVSAELDEDRPDWQERDKRVHELRTEAMAEIWSAHGLDGALALLVDCDCDAWIVGASVARCAADPHTAVDVLRTCLSSRAGSEGKLDAFMQGFLPLLDDGTRSAVISALAKSVGVDQVVRLFKCAPFRDQTWRLLDQQDKAVLDRYWRTVAPKAVGSTESETNEIIDRLLEVERPRAAFCAVQFDWEKVETSRLKSLLIAFVNVNTEPAGEYEIESWSFSEALDSLGKRPGVTVDEMARLEFAYIDALVDSEHGIPNIERKVIELPSLFVHALALCFKRRDGGQDPPEWRVEDPDRRASLGQAAYRLLHEIKRVPGTNLDGEVDAHALSQWVAEARRLCRENGRAEIGDQKIGELLSKAPSEEDGSWPCPAVCEVLEAVASEDIASGFEIGVYNARGVVSRSLDEGGKQERELSARYLAWARRLAFDYPYVAKSLQRIAESYNRDAEREDSEVRVMKRLEH